MQEIISGWVGEEGNFSLRSGETSLHLRPKVICFKGMGALLTRRNREPWSITKQSSIVSDLARSRSNDTSSPSSAIYKCARLLTLLQKKLTSNTDEFKISLEVEFDCVNNFQVLGTLFTLKLF